MYNGFTRGIITGAIIGMTVGVMFPTKNTMRMGKRAFRNGKSMIRKAGNMLDSVIDIW